MTKEWVSSKSMRGFTIVELLIVVVVIAILAAITIVSYNGITQRAKTSSSLSTAQLVGSKAGLWNALIGSYPDLAQLRTNSMSPTNIDTPGGEPGPIEAKLSTPSVAMGATINVVRADEGRTVYYAPCWDGEKFSGATIAHWDYSTNSAVDTVTGICP